MEPGTLEGFFFNDADWKDNRSWKDGLLKLIFAQMFRHQQNTA